MVSVVRDACRGALWPWLSSTKGSAGAPCPHMTPWLGVEGGIVDGGGLPEGLHSACEGWFPSTQTAPAILAENVTRSPRDIDFGLPPCVPRI